jgi:hypothetical protein
MFSDDRTLPPSLESIIAAGAPAKDTPSYWAVHGELSDFVARGRVGLDMMERDLSAGDLQAAIETLRTMHRSHASRLNRIEAGVGDMPPRNKAAALTLRWAPPVLLTSILTICAIDLLDMGGWHHPVWLIPAVCAVSVWAIRRMTR